MMLDKKHRRFWSSSAPRKYILRALFFSFCWWWWRRRFVQSPRFLRLGSSAISFSFWVREKALENPGIMQRLLLLIVFHLRKNLYFFDHVSLKKEKAAYDAKSVWSSTSLGYKNNTQAQSLLQVFTKVGMHVPLFQNDWIIQGCIRNQILFQQPQPSQVSHTGESKLVFRFSPTSR